jgi:uroporphyrinogen decarboxylase
MTHRERVLKICSSETTDRIARGEFFIADEFVRAFLSLDDNVAATHDHRAAVVEELDFDMASVALSWGWGSPQQPDEDSALESLVRWRAKSDRFVFAVIDGPFSVAAKTVGFDAMMRYIHTIPHVAIDYYRKGAEEATMLAQAARDAGADGVVLGEDLAYNRSTFFSPKQLRECYFPALAQAVRDIHELGLVVFFHSDGNLNSVLDNIAASGVDGLQGLEPDGGMSIAAARERLGQALTMWGNLSFDFLSAARSDQEIQSALRDLVTPSQRRLIIGSCGGLVAGMNVETVRRFYRAIG